MKIILVALSLLVVAACGTPADPTLWNAWRYIDK